MKTDAIPVTLLTGFLGAGKTTYLNQLLAHDAPRGSLVLVNDFGDVNIDAELIAYQDENILRLSNGCICCTLGGSLAEQLAAILRMPVLPTAIFIEASGISKPSRIVDTVTVSPHLCMHEVVCLVDASQAERHAHDPRCADVWRMQIRVADRLVVNRHRPDQDAAQVNTALRELANGGSGTATGRFAASLEPASGGSPGARLAHGEPRRHADRWQSCSIRFDNPVDAARLEALMHQYADVLVRAKGILRRSGVAGLEAFQLSGTDMRWQSIVRRPGKSQLVCIGAKGPRFAELAAALQRLDQAST